MAKLYYQGHGSFRLTASDGRVIYVDPYVGDGYDKPADILLRTHRHGDHNELGLVTQKPGCRVITETEALAGGEHNSFSLDGIEIRAVRAENSNHDPKECVGFLIFLDSVKIYASGDTSKTEQMRDFAALSLDYTLLCGDGVYNMDPAEAAECAEIIGAKRNILIHMAPGKLFDSETAENWQAPNRLLLRPSEEIEL